MIDDEDWADFGNYVSINRFLGDIVIMIDTANPYTTLLNIPVADLDMLIDELERAKEYLHGQEDNDVN